MKQKLLLLAFTVLSNMLFSQAVPMAFEDWSTTTGSQNFFIKSISKTDAYGNIYVAGATVNGAGDYDILLAKYSSSGVQLWIQQYAGAGNGTDFAGGLVVTDTYAILTGAVTTSTASPTTDIITIKYNSSGVFQWATTYNGAGNNFDAAKHVVLDGSGNIYVTGASYNASVNTDMVTIKYNSSGTQQWVSTYNYSSNLDDAATKVVISGSNLTVTGPVTSSANNYKLATLTYAQSTGSLTATNISTATTTSSITAVTDLTADGSNNNYIVGCTFVSGQGYNYYVQKLNVNTLVTAWTYTYNGSSNLDDVAKNVVVDASGNVYITGYSTSSTQGRDIVTIKLNSSGTFQWSQTINGALNGNDEANDMVIDASSNLYVTGYMTDALNNMDYYTTKYNSSGTKLWEIQTDGTHLNDQATNIVLDSLGNVIVCGQFESAPSTYGFGTVRYVQKDVITPTDFNGETPSANFMYYPNKGQITDTLHTPVSDVKFYTNNTNPVFYFKNRSQSFVFAKNDTATVNHKDTLQRIDLTFTNSSEGAKTYPLEQQKNGYINYFVPQAGSGGITGVFGNKRLITHNLYNNIDLMTTSNQNGVKYYFIVKPGGDMRDIKLEFTGATSYSLNGTTNYLSINSKIGSVTFDKPIAYQLTSANATVAVTSFSPTWTVDGASNKYKFNSGTYTSSLTLVIEVDQGNSSFLSSTVDNLKWSTYLGKSSPDVINKIRTNGSSLFTAGYTYSSVFPQGTGLITVYQISNGGSIDGFISKFSNVGELIWSTFVGGTKNDNLTDITFGSNGDIYCVGSTNSGDLVPIPKIGADNDNTFDGPVSNSFFNASAESYIFQLAQDGLTSPWLRFYGGDQYDYLTSCTIDANNNLFVAGFSNSSNIANVTPSGSYALTNPSVSPYLNSYDGVITKFNSSSVITWQTYIGSKSSVGSPPNDYIMDITLSSDDSGVQDLYVGGFTYGNDYPVVYTSGQSHYTGSFNESFLTRFSNNGAILWSTYLSGSGQEEIMSLSYSDMLYATGRTNSSDFLSINSGHDYFQSSNGGGSDAFFVKVNNNNVITHSTYLGGTNDEVGLDLAADYANNTMYISCYTNGSGFPIPTNNPFNTYNHSYSGGGENIICALKSNMTSILWATYVGGTYDEVVFAPAGDLFYHQSICNFSSNLYLGSLTKSSESSTTPFPLNDNGGLPTYFQPILDGSMDATITKFDLVPVYVIGVKENENINQSVLLFPNPATSSINILFDEKIDKLNYRIVNALGQTTKSGTLNSSTYQINISSLSSGFYFIELSDDKSKFTGKFVKND